MSAECETHGCHLVYPPDSWPVGVCRECELEAQIAVLLGEKERAERLCHREAESKTRFASRWAKEKRARMQAEWERDDALLERDDALAEKKRVERDLARNADDMEETA